MSRKIFIFSIPRESALGISDWTSTSSGKKLQKTKIGRATERIPALRDPRVGGLANYISYNPWIDSKTGLPKKDEKGTTLTLQDYLEEKWRLPKDYLHNRPWRNGESLDPAKMSYYQTKAWTLREGTTMFDLDDMEQELGYYVMLDSPYVANSEKEWRAHKWPNAKWYIALDNESESIKHQKNEYKGKALAKLYSVEFTDTYKLKFVIILNLGKAQTTYTKEQVENMLFEFIDKASTTSPSPIDKFNALFELLSKPTGREEIEARYILQQSLDTKVAYEKHGTYTFTRPQGPLVIGDRYEDAIEFLLSPKKSKEVEELTTAIKLKLS